MALGLVMLGVDTGRDTPSREVKQYENMKKYSLPCWSFGGNTCLCPGRERSREESKEARSIL